MKKSMWVLVPLLAAPLGAVAWSQTATGYYCSSTSVACGTKKSGKQTTDLLCQEYVVRSSTTDYTIRQPKPEETGAHFAKYCDPVHPRQKHDEVQGQREVFPIRGDLPSRCIFCFALKQRIGEVVR
jgi:hypothetical protein